jgi:SAM-dependent methyltransferase
MEAREALTESAQRAWKSALGPRSWAIDATAGNGHDTRFLAETVAPGGHVFAFDIQDAALKATASRLDAANLLERVTLIKGDHARMRDSLPCGIRGQVRLVCFNLGYLPGGDHSCTTRPESTLPALHEALLLLAPEGLLSVIAYRGHPGAEAEAASVAAFFNHLPAPWQCLQHRETGNPPNPGPVWWLAGQASPAEKSTGTAPAR